MLTGTFSDGGKSPLRSSRLETPRFAGRRADAGQQHHAGAATERLLLPRQRLLKGFLPICNLLIESPDESLVVIKTRGRGVGGY